MKVILLHDVRAVGKKGEVKECKEGYVKNYLLPRGLAKLATQEALAFLAQTKQADASRAEKERENAQILATCVNDITLRFTLKISKNTTFGSITKQMIEDALLKEGITLPRNAILLDKPIKKTGDMEVPVSLHEGVRALLHLHIEKK
ncbi:MAG: 50S ribosomal protein L9 [Patescibacteria group bacterium]|nr:50S ribosomal protein L9 [Patescibacteria group bacterium]MDE2437871.1 50S ribosomal protein L9 [Patescibacteria group bacterium]